MRRPRADVNHDPYSAGILSHDHPGELARLRAVESVLDPVSVRVLEECGIRSDWNCLELGAGAGSIAYWLASQCSIGHITAVDVDTGFLAAERDNLTIIEQDALACAFSSNPFDLIHTRAFLVHLPERAKLLERAAGWLRPGGWLVTEEPLTIGAAESPYPEFCRLVDGMQRLLEIQGADLRWARSLPLILHDLGFENSQINMQILPCGQGGNGDLLWRRMFSQIRSALIERHILSIEQYNAGMSLFDSPSFADVSLGVISVSAQLTRLTAEQTLRRETLT